MIKLLWHEPSNFMCLVDMKNGKTGLPLMTVCDEEYKSGINPFYSYPLEYLCKFYGFVDLGEF